MKRGSGPPVLLAWAMLLCSPARPHRPRPSVVATVGPACPVARSEQGPARPTPGAQPTWPPSCSLLTTGTGRMRSSSSRWVVSRAGAMTQGAPRSPGSCWLAPAAGACLPRVCAPSRALGSRGWDGPVVKCADVGTTSQEGEVWVFLRSAAAGCAEGQWRGPPRQRPCVWRGRSVWPVTWGWRPWWPGGCRAAPWGSTGLERKPAGLVPSRTARAEEVAGRGAL